MVDAKAIDPSPEYQRRERWDQVKQSALIESFLLNVPVPPVYLAEEDFGVYSVIDGKQRITAIHDFMRGRLALKHLQELPELNGDRIAELPESMANALRMRPYIRAVTLLKQSSPDLKYEVFIRLNTGGEALTAQEVRNVAFRGPLNELILKLGAEPFLRDQFRITDSSERYRQMQDAEYVLRFLALAEFGTAYKGGLAETMNRFMVRHVFATLEELNEFEHRFRKALYDCRDIWREYAFRRADDGLWRGRALLGMYDAQMLAVASLGEGELSRAKDRRSAVVESTARLFDDPSFTSSVTVSTNTTGRLFHRVNAIIQLLLGV
ncbi:DUF262 domain-containing protein [Micromonospora sp. CV4]|nr:DUF262 domain-containing protein [Micromonospora sp. CV4]